MTVSSWFSFLADENLDTYCYLYVGYMDDYLNYTLVNYVGIKYVLMKKIGHENGVIAGFMKT